MASAIAHKIQLRNLLTLVPDKPNIMGGRPKFLERRGVPPEVFQLLSALETAAEAVGRVVQDAARVPAWRDELHRSVARLTSLLLVHGESGGPSVLERLSHLEERLARIEGVELLAAKKKNGGVR